MPLFDCSGCLGRVAAGGGCADLSRPGQPADLDWALLVTTIPKIWFIRYVPDDLVDGRQAPGPAHPSMEPEKLKQRCEPRPAKNQAKGDADGKLGRLAIPATNAPHL